MGDFCHDVQNQPMIVTSEASEQPVLSIRVAVMANSADG
jgi:hypothetical protein